MESKNSLKSGANPEQEQAITWGKGPLLVLAGPGSGKTYVITKRICYLTEVLQVPAAHILVVTFSRAAAREMEERFAASAGRKRTGVTFGTFHSFFFGILRTAYGYAADQVASDAERSGIVTALIRRNRMESGDAGSLTADILSEISAVKETKTDLRNYYSVNCPAELFRQIFGDYEKALADLKKIDYEDMLLMTYDLLKERQDIRAACAARYRWILVDEFQDINRLQYEIIKMLAGETDNLTVVGDDDQSIYRFRGAKPEIMLGFEKEHPGTGKVILGRNYRSTPEITAAAGRLISRNTRRFAKKIEAVRPGGEPVRISLCPDPPAEVSYLLKKIRELNRQGIPYRETAVLYRTNMQPRLLAAALLRENIPFRMKERLPDLTEHWIARDFISYLRLAEGTGSRSDLLRISNHPNRYIRRDALASGRDAGLAGLERFYADKVWMLERIRRLRHDLLSLSKMRVRDAIACIRGPMGYDAFLAEYAKEHEIDESELTDYADEIEESSEDFPTVDGWLAHLKDFSEELAEKRKKAADAGKEEQDEVHLMTFHASKGLEFGNVFILDANAGITPYRKAREGDETEEERRMFYVAMTRARDRLEILTCRKRFHREAEPSVFLAELK